MEIQSGNANFAAVLDSAAASRGHYACRLNVEVDAIEYELEYEPDSCDAPKDWHLVFEIDCGGISCMFDARSPHLCSLTKWRDLANGNGRVAPFLRDGQGAIVADGQYFKFFTGPFEGLGLDSLVQVPVGAVANKLSSALDKAVKNGYRFG